MRKTGLRGFRPGPTQIGLYIHKIWLEAWNFGFRKKSDCTIRVAKTKALISFAVTAKLICVFVFEYVKSRVSHDAAHTNMFLMIELKEQFKLRIIISACILTNRFDPISPFLNEPRQKIFWFSFGCYVATFLVTDAHSVDHMFFFFIYKLFPGWILGSDCIDS